MIGHHFCPKNSPHLSDALVCKCFNAFFTSCFFNVQDSQPFITRPINRNLVLLLTDLFFHTFSNMTRVSIPMASLDLTSLAQSASFVTLQSKYTKEFTCSI